MQTKTSNSHKQNLHKRFQLENPTLLMRDNEDPGPNLGLGRSASCSILLRQVFDLQRAVRGLHVPNKGLWTSGAWRAF